MTSKNKFKVGEIVLNEYGVAYKVIGKPIKENLYPLQQLCAGYPHYELVCEANLRALDDAIKENKKVDQ